MYSANQKSDWNTWLTLPILMNDSNFGSINRTEVASAVTCSSENSFNLPEAPSFFWTVMTKYIIYTYPYFILIECVHKGCF